MKSVFRILYKSLIHDRPQTLSQQFETYQAAEDQIRELLSSPPGSLFGRTEYWIEKVYMRGDA